MAKHISATKMVGRYIKALRGFTGNLTGNVTGDLTGNASAVLAGGLFPVLGTPLVTTAALTGTSVVMDFDIPIGAWILGHSLRVNVAVTDDDGDDTWSAAYSGGSTVSICSATAAAKNTKVNGFSLLVEGTPNTLLLTSSSLTDVTLTPQGTNFDAGVISGQIFYMLAPALADLA